MITYKINGITKEIKNKLSEISINEFERICKIMVEKDGLEKYIEIFNIEELDSIENDEFINLIKQYDNDMNEWESTEFIKSIIIKDKEYRAYENNEYKLSIRDLAKIEKYIKNNNNSYITEMMAVIYKDISVNKELWYNDIHLNEKINIFRENMKANIVIPYINLISKLNDTKILG